MSLHVFGKRVLFRINIFVVIGATFMFLFLYSELNDVFNLSIDDTDVIDGFDDIYWSFSHETIVHWFHKKRKGLNTSNLGSILFKDDVYDQSMLEDREPRNYTVLIWKFYDDLARRHLYNYKSKITDPLENCTVRNCLFTGDSTMLEEADAVVVHLHRGDFPNTTGRDPTQRWIFLSDESPGNTFARAKIIPQLRDIAGVFNWSMTYRTESDIPVPYGRVVPLKKPKLKDAQSDLTSVIPFWKEKNSSVIVAVLVSHCIEFRMNYIKKLQNYVDVDVYGKCSEDKKKSCPGYFKSDCKAIDKYIFYLSFENSMCHEYITEKVYYHAYAKGAIPVIMGPSLEDCQTLLPPSSYIHVGQFKRPEDLANKLIKISKNPQMLLSYHRWRNHFKVLNEHGYFQTTSVHYCRVCEALNYNSEEPKVYGQDQLEQFLDRKTSCRT